MVPAAQAFLRQLVQSLEAAMQQHQEAGAGRKQVVHAVQLVRAIPFYGYHPDQRLFIKIVLYNPSQVTRVATLMQVMLITRQPPAQSTYLQTCGKSLKQIYISMFLLQSGAVMNRSFQPHESHIPFLLQFKASQAALSKPATTH